MKDSASPCQFASRTAPGERNSIQSDLAASTASISASRPEPASDLAAGGVGDLQGSVARTGIDDDHLADDALDSGRDERPKGEGEIDLIVAGGQNHADHRLLLDLMPPIFEPAEPN